MHLHSKSKVNKIRFIAFLFAINSYALLGQTGFFESGISASRIVSTASLVGQRTPGMYFGAGGRFRAWEVSGSFRQDDYHYSTSYYRSNSAGLQAGWMQSVGPLDLGLRLGGLYRLASIQQSNSSNGPSGNALYEMDVFVSPVLRLEPFPSFPGYKLTVSYQWGLMNLDPNDDLIYRTRSWSLGFIVPLQRTDNPPTGKP